MKPRQSRLGAVTKPAVLALAAGLLRRMRPDSIVALLPLLGELSAADNGRATPAMIRRTLTRIRAVQRWAELRSSTACRGWTDRAVGQLVCDELRETDPKFRCSPRSLRRWVDTWNDRPDGCLAAGPVGLADAYTAGPKPRDPNPRGRQLRRLIPSLKGV